MPMNNGAKSPELFKYGSTWIRADFHLHTNADKEFTYSNDEDYYFSSYVKALEEQKIKTWGYYQPQQV